MKKLIIFPPFDLKTEVCNIVEQSQCKIVGVLQKDRLKSRDWNKEITKLPTWTHDQILSVHTVHNAKPDLDIYDTCLKKILCDPRSFYLADRLYGIESRRNSFKNTVILETAVWNSLSIIDETLPDSVILYNTPHSLPTWVFGRVAEIMGLPVYFFKSSPLIWRSWIVRGPDEQKIISPFVADNKKSVVIDGEKALSSTTVNFLNRDKRYCDTTGAHYDYIYERLSHEERKIKLKLNYLNVANHTKVLSLIKKKIYAIKEVLQGKDTLIRKYSHYSQPFKLPEQFGSFMLQFQPERTSLPEGYLFSQQILAIRRISEALPENVYLVVKEHPHMRSEMALYSSQSGVRSDEFYDSLISMRNVVLAPLNFDSIQLVTKGIFVSTLTGKIGIEAILRNKPVLAFGAASYSQHPLVYNVITCEDVRNAISDLITKNSSTDNRFIEEFFSWVEGLTFERSRLGLETINNGESSSLKTDPDLYLRMLTNLLANNGLPVEAPTFQVRSRF